MFRENHSVPLPIHTTDKIINSLFDNDLIQFTSLPILVLDGLFSSVFNRFDCAAFTLTHPARVLSASLRPALTGPRAAAPML